MTCSTCNPITNCATTPLCTTSAASTCGACTTGYTGPTCSTCAEGYTLSGSTCININACTDYPCTNGGTCTDLPPSAGNNPDGRTCACVTGTYFTGTVCTTCNLPEHCTTGTCDGPTVGTCSACASGFHLVGNTCVPNDPCDGRPPASSDLIITGLIHTPSFVAIELYAVRDIVELSDLGLAIGNLASAFFPSRVVLAGEFVTLTNHPAAFATYFGAEALPLPVLNFQDGNQAFVLIGGDLLEPIDSYGVAAAPGGEWRVFNSWAYRRSTSTARPDGTFVATDWLTSEAGVCVAPGTCIPPLRSYSPSGNPCGVGTCLAAANTYACVCPDGTYDDDTTCVACAPIANCQTGLTCDTNGISACGTCSSGFYGPMCAACTLPTGCTAATCSAPGISQCTACAGDLVLENGTCVAPVVPTRVAFVINDATRGRELVVSDCTPAGTRLVDIHLMTGGGFDEEACIMQFDPITCEDFQQDCNDDPSANPFCSVSGSGAPEQLIAFRNTLDFTADNGFSGRELWRLTADGTPELVHNLRSAELSAFESNAASSAISRIAVFNDKLYFQAQNDTNGIELFSFGGNPGDQITLVHDFNPANETGGVPAWITPTPNRLYMEVSNAPGGQDQLWYVTPDGNVGQIQLPTPPSATQTLVKLSALGGHLAFQALDAEGVTRLYLLAPDADTPIPVGTLPRVDTLSIPFAAPELEQFFFAGLNGEGADGLAWVDINGQSGFLGPAGTLLNTSAPFAYEAGRSEVYFTQNPTGALYRTNGVTVPVQVVESAGSPLGLGGYVYYVSTADVPKQLMRFSPTSGASEQLYDFDAVNTTAYSIVATGNLLVLALWDGVACVDLTNPATPTITVIQNNPVGGSVWTEGSSNNPENKLFTSF
jgi:ELWxxDGT repeat protein